MSVYMRVYARTHVCMSVLYVCACMSVCGYARMVPVCACCACMRVCISVNVRVYQVCVCSMRVQGAPVRGWPTPPATLAQEEKVHQIMRSGQRSMIECGFFTMIVVANWRLDNTKSPATMLQGKTARTPHTLCVTGGSARYACSHAVRTYIHTPGGVILFFF